MDIDTPQILLRKIWSFFSKAQYVEEQEIIEYIAYLLTNDLPPLSDKLRAERPRNRYGLEETPVRRALEDAATLLKNEGGVATFFNRYVLFQSTRQRRTSTYPIPRHIVDFMLALVDVTPEHSFTDFTCGTGGFLVKRDGLTSQHPGFTFGVEIAPELARIAHANALLHGFRKEHCTIEIGNAFNVCAKSEWHDRMFDRIAMAPPFGETVDATALFADITDRSSELLFMRLALQKLSTRGQAIVMVPPSLGRTEASYKIRRELIEEHTLKAVISLGENILQPFTPMPVYLLLFAKAHTTLVTPIWFLDIAYDGYPLSANRNLIAPPPSDIHIPNDLPSATSVILSTSENFPAFQLIPQWQQIGVNNDQTLYSIPLSDTAVIVLKVHENATLASIRYFQNAKKGNYLLVQASLRGHVPAYTVIPLATATDLATIFNIADPVAWQREYFDLPSTAREDEIQGGSYIFGRGTSGQMIAITPDGRLLGFTKLPREVADTNYALTERYRRMHAEPVIKEGTTATTLQDIHTRQLIIERYVDNLLGQLEIKNIVGQPLPPPLFVLDDFSLIVHLDIPQRELWDYIVTTFTLDGIYAFYFLPTQLPDYTQRRVYIEQTLQLLERLGLIVQVTIKQPQDDKVISCYRRVTVIDRKKWQQMEEESNHEATENSY